MATEFTGEVVRLALIAGNKATIRDHVFRDCDVYGPAVLVPQGSTIEHCGFDGEPEMIVWRLRPEQDRVLGAILLDNCRFTGCRFHHIGLLPPPDRADEMLAALKDDS